MLKNPELLRQMEDDFIRNNRLSYAEAIKLFTSMWKEAVKLGVLPPKDPMEGIEKDLRLARIINSCSKRLSPG